MITISVKGNKGVTDLLARYPKQARRAMEMALDATAKVIREDIKAVMKSAFSNPVAWTMNSLKVTPTKGHNMRAMVGFKEPGRMGQHYLVPEVEGGVRRLKGFERAVDAFGGEGQYNLASGTRTNNSGNITHQQSKQIIAGVKSKTDYVIITKAVGKLIPGVYKRVKTGKGFGGKVGKTLLGASQKGRKRGRFTSAITARGLVPVLFKARSEKVYRPKLDFYGVAGKTFNARFEGVFWDKLAGLVK